MNQVPNNEPIRRAVLRISHDVDATGRVVNVELEPMADACAIDAIEAAWSAARRCHPWIVGDAEKLHVLREIALTQVVHLMNTADEVLLMLMGMETIEVRRLREALIDLRGYLPALRGEIPKQIQLPENKYRRAG